MRYSAEAIFESGNPLIMNDKAPSSSMRVISCAGCGQDNPSDRKFCGNCGQRLWLPCLECSSINAIDEKFCGNCGVKLEDSVQQREDELKAKLELAIRMEKEGRFYDAASKLREITEGDERLGKYTQNAMQLLNQLEQRRVARTEESEQLAAQARVYFKRQEYTKSFESLKAIPIGLRSKPVVDFMVEVEGFHKELAELNSEIRSSLKAKNYEGLRPRVERLCQLQPNNEEAKKLLGRLAKLESDDQSKQSTLMARLAQKKIAERRFREAAEAAAKIGPEFRKGPIEQVYRKARELYWCTEQLRRSTVATPNLQKVAERWLKLTPDDGRAKKLQAQLTERLQQRTRDRRFGNPPWSAMPEQPAIGAPLKLWTGFAGAEPEDAEVQADLKKLPGRFSVAYGLALQGLGKAKMTHDLNPKRKLFGMSFSRGKTDRCWGLDVGSTSIKAIELFINEDQIVIAQSLLIPHSRPLHKVREDAQADIITESVEQFVEETGVKKPRVAASFPGRHGLARFFDLPPIKSKKTKLKDAVGFEMKAQIPMPIDEAVFDFHAWEPVADGFTELRPIAAMAARKEIMQEWVAPIIAGGCEIALLQCDGFALFNALHHEFIANHAEETAIAVIDVGGDTTNVVVGERNYVWMRSIVHGVKRWDDAIERELPVKGSQVAKLRQDPSLAKWMHQVVDTMEPDFGELLGDLQRSLNGYPRKSLADIGLILGTGGGFSQFGFPQTLLYGESTSAT